MARGVGKENQSKQCGLEVTLCVHTGYPVQTSLRPNVTSGEEVNGHLEALYS